MMDKVCYCKDIRELFQDINEDCDPGDNQRFI